MKVYIKNFCYLTKILLNIILIIIFVFNILNCNVLAIRNSENINVSAKSAILICADSCDIIYSKNESEPRSMASTTKIMTAVLALEQISAFGNKEIEITDEMVKVEGTSMGLMPKDVVSLDVLTKGMMLCSGNDAANAIAIALSGNQDDFAKLMNEKAKSIGMNNVGF